MVQRPSNFSEVIINLLRNLYFSQWKSDNIQRTSTESSSVPFFLQKVKQTSRTPA